MWLPVPRTKTPRWIWRAGSGIGETSSATGMIVPRQCVPRQAIRSLFPGPAGWRDGQGRAMMPKAAGGGAGMGGPGRQLKLGAFLYTPGSHSAGWRHPDAVPETDMSFTWYVH